MFHVIGSSMKYENPGAHFNMQDIKKHYKSILIWMYHQQMLNVLC